MTAEPSDLPSTTGDTAEGRVDRSDTVSALERGISVLRCFSEDRPFLGHAEIARITGIPRPTVNRLVATLLSLGMLRPATSPAAGDRFMLGPGVVSLARVFLANLDVRAAARPAMQTLAEQLGASVYLAVRDGMEMVLIEACRPRSSMLSARLDVGSRAPLPNSALGRAYLSAMPEAQRTQLIDSMRLLRGPEWDRHRARHGARHRRITPAGLLPVDGRVPPRDQFGVGAAASDPATKSWRSTPAARLSSSPKNGCAASWRRDCTTSRWPSHETSAAWCRCL